MINKLPVVGERYVYKTAKDSKGFLAGLFKSEGIFTFDGGTILRFVPEHFWNIFEELPDSNPQEEPNLLAKDGWCGGREPLPTREEFYERLREQNKTESVDLEKGEVSEVERALEELKYKLNNPVCDTGVLRMKAQKLVNALEAEKARPKPEPKIDMKEECVEPVSIWKDVSELPESSQEVFLKFKNHNRVNRGFFAAQSGIFENDWDELDKDYISGFCTLTDFINSFEQTQKDIAELKQQIKKQNV